MSLGNVTLLVGLLAALAVPPAQQTRSPIRLVEGNQAVQLDLADVPIADFLEAAQPILGVPVQALPDEVVPPHFHQSGEMRVAAVDFRDAFDAVLRLEGFWNWDDTSGGTPVIVVRRAWTTKLVGNPVLFTPPVISLEELAAGPKRRGPQYTVAFPLQHVNARDMLVVLMGVLDSAVEIVRHVDGSNQLLVTASREHLLAVRDALAKVDVPGPDAPGAELQLSALRDRLSELERRVEALEKKAGG